MAKKNLFELTGKEIEELISAGGMAPSGGNVQPWRVVVKDKITIELMLDKKRSETFLDVGCFASYMALGSFMENLTIVAESLGLVYEVVKFKPSNPFSPLIQITFTDRQEKRAIHPLYTEIAKRVTNRKLYNGKIITESIIKDLKEQTRKRDDNFTLFTVQSEKDKKAVSDILGKADGIRTFHKILFKQMLSEIRWNEKEVRESLDGIDMETLELPLMVSKIMKLMKDHPSVVSTFPREVFENQAKPLLMHSSHLCCITMKGDPTPDSMVRAGGVLQILWLNATKHKLALHPWTVLPFFLIRLKYFNGEGFSEEEKTILGTLDNELTNVFDIPKEETPLFIFRLSFAEPPSSRSLRLPWQAFTEMR